MAMDPAALDCHITGNYGEDFFKGDPPEDEDLETCSWCTTEWPDTELREAPDGARICPDCYAEADFGGYDDRLSDGEADSMTLASAGWGTEEDYGYYGDGEC